MKLPGAQQASITETYDAVTNEANALLANLQECMAKFPQDEYPKNGTRLIC